VDVELLSGKSLRPRHIVLTQSVNERIIRLHPSPLNPPLLVLPARRRPGVNLTNLIPPHTPFSAIIIPREVPHRPEADIHLPVQKSWSSNSRMVVLIGIPGRTRRAGNGKQTPASPRRNSEVDVYAPTLHMTLNSAVTVRPLLNVDLPRPSRSSPARPGLTSLMPGPLRVVLVRHHERASLADLSVYATRLLKAQGNMLDCTQYQRFTHLIGSYF
jgi:hypothetical protein